MQRMRFVNIKHCLLIKRALASAETPAIIQPASLSRSDSNRPDGLTIVPCTGVEDAPWCGTSLVQSPDTLALSHLNRAVVGPGAVANETDENKKSASTVRLHTHCNGDSWSCRGVGVGLSTKVWTPASPEQLWSHVHSCFCCSVSTLHRPPVQ